LKDIYTVKRRGSGEIVVKGSRFVCNVSRAASREEAASFFNSAAVLDAKADHHVTAYRIGPEGLVYGSSDGGEPAGSAGQPIIGLLEKELLTDVAVSVARYYGGTNLGIGGLIRAYTSAVRGAIADAGKARLRSVAEISIRGQHDTMAQLENLLSGEGYAPRDRRYGADAILVYTMDEDELEGVQALIRARYGRSVEIETRQRGLLPLEDKEDG